MGGAASTGPMPAHLVRKVFDPANAFKASRGSLKLKGGKKPGCDALAAYSIIGGQPHAITTARAAILRLREEATKAASDANLKEACGQKRGSASMHDKDEGVLDRSLGCMLGNVVGDALGGPLEFSPVRYGEQELLGMDHDAIWENQSYNRFDLKSGQWTDDASMMLCLADSLLVCGEFDGLDIRQRFYLWNKHGYNNAFGRDPDRKCRQSVGLGGNISMSIEEWERQEERTAATCKGNKFTSGNGSLMRNGALPLWFRDDLPEGLKAAAAQSRTTHGGDEAAELCRLLTFACIRLINGAGRKVFDELADVFETPLYTVACMAAGKPEEPHADNSDKVFGSLTERRWDWKSPNHTYSMKRACDDPSYVGSYAMDCMSMALHCVYTTSSFTEATLKAANLCGDSDTVCAVVGQLAGALYGASAIPAGWLERVERWDGGGSIAGRAQLLHDHHALGREASLSDAACASATDLEIIPASLEEQESKPEAADAVDQDATMKAVDLDKLKQVAELLSQIKKDRRAKKGTT